MVKLFRSSLAPHIESFLQEKKAFGYRYISEEAQLRRLDRFLTDHRCPADALPRELVESFTAKRSNERPRSHKARMWIVRQFARFMGAHGLRAYVPDTKLTPMTKLDFTPYIFTREQIRQVLQAVDRLPFTPQSPERHLVFPELFRLLYGCGLRVGEAMRLRVEDIDLDKGILTIRQSKFRKDRFVPIASSLADRLRHYAEAMKLSEAHLVFFPNPWGKCYSPAPIYNAFRRALWDCGIPHGGRNKGPRLHDLRHTFAVHCLERWYRNGDDLNARIPLLVAYLGHQNLTGTQRYLRLTPEIFPDITKRLEAFLHAHTFGGTPS